MSETDLKRAVMALLAASGWVVTRAQAGRLRKGVQLAQAGTGDLICCAHGRYVEVEIKTENGAVRPSQLKRASAVIQNGGTYRFVRSVKDARELVEEMGRRVG